MYLRSVQSSSLADCLVSYSPVGGSWMNSIKRGMLSVTHLGLQSLAILALVALLVPNILTAYASSPANNSSLKNYQHVFIIMMENTGYTHLIGNPGAPWINSAAATYGLATNYTGVTHPSQPNYIAATSGSTNGVTSDIDVTLYVPNIVDQLEAHGKTWKAYMQSYALCTTPLAHACGNQLYERKHNPFVSYQDVQNNPACVANIVDFSQFATDLASGNVADYTWISPDQCHDMHGR